MVIGIKVWIYRGKIFAERKSAKTAFSTGPSGKREDKIKTD